MADKSHWESIYETKVDREVSWFQEHAVLSTRLVRATGVGLDAQIIDVGGGASRLVDDLLDAGYANLTVLDISGAALRRSRERLGPRASRVGWIESDITAADLPAEFYDIWHDRAVFHFLTDEADRAAYVGAVERSVRSGGHVIVASFGLGGPVKCSGLDVVRYSPNTMHGEFGDRFTLVGSSTETHETPFGTTQEFIYCYCRKD